MKKLVFTLIILAIVTRVFNNCCNHHPAISSVQDTILVSDTIQYHAVRINKADGSILPWFSADKGESYDTVLMLVWDFWSKMAIDSNGLKYYLNHQVWKPEHDMRGLGGDQINMALSSWTLLYAYTGNPFVLQNMKYLADNYLERSLSDSISKWPYLPYPYNTIVHSGRYDGDMRNGKGITQPDKAGNFGYELINLYKITSDQKYLEAAKKIAHTLIAHVVPGNENKSPLPFRVNAKTGESGFLFFSNMSGKKVEPALYTSNWACTMMLFEELKTLDVANKDNYEKSFTTILNWMKAYPLKTNKWGPFFEDISGWSDTQTNAITFSQFMMNHQEYFPDWKTEVEEIFKWVYKILGNKSWGKYGVIVVNEQTEYQVPGNSHTSRQAAAELQYVSLTGNNSRKENAIRQLNWVTYMVDFDGKNRYPQDDIWLTDGYGDYVRHYLRAMAAFPELSPSDEEHILYSSSIIQQVEYKNQIVTNLVPANPDNKNIRLRYTTYDNTGIEKIHLLNKPMQVMLGRKAVPEINNLTNEGYKWEPLRNGGILTISRVDANEITIID